MNCCNTPNSAALITSSTAVSTSTTTVISISTAVPPDRSDTGTSQKYGLEHLRIGRERLTKHLPAHTLDFALRLDEVQLRLSKLRRIHESHTELPAWYVSGFKNDLLNGVYRCRDEMPVGGQNTYWTQSTSTYESSWIDESKWNRNPAAVMMRSLHLLTWLALRYTPRGPII